MTIWLREKEQCNIFYRSSRPSTKVEGVEQPNLKLHEKCLIQLYTIIQNLQIISQRDKTHLQIFTDIIRTEM